MSASVLCAAHLRVEIGRRTILADLSLQAAPGEFISIIGPNGAGKSTLLRALRGTLPSKGRIEVCGKKLRVLSDKETVRYILTCRKMCRSISALRRLDRLGRSLSVSEVVAERTRRGCCDRSSLHGVYQRREACATVCGERQRVLLAKAFAQETPLLFLDEPTANLDLTYQEEIFRHCRGLCRAKAGAKLIVMVVHDIRLAAKFCLRLLLLADGKILADGAPHAVVTEQHLSMRATRRALH